MAYSSNNKASYLIGVISDTHGLLRSEAAIAFKNVNLIIHAGDIGSPDVLDGLQKIAPVKAVKGNMDAGDWTRKLPPSDMIEIGNIWLYVLHDVYKLDLIPSSANISAVISGHTHRPSSDWKNGVLFLNPGTVGPFKPPISVALLKIKGKKLDSQFVSLH